MMWDVNAAQGSSHPQSSTGYREQISYSSTPGYDTSMPMPLPFSPIGWPSSVNPYEAHHSPTYGAPASWDMPPQTDRSIGQTQHYHRHSGHRSSSGHHSSGHSKPPRSTSHHPPPQIQPADSGYASGHSYAQQAPPAPRNHSFQYSRCNRKKKALCIGINYQGQQNELHGCVNDAKNVRQFLMDHYNYHHEDIALLTDDASDPRRQPTKKNMLAAMNWLVKDAQPDDALFFHYSGHGGQTKDLDGDEVDGYDEVIFPVDYLKNGFITDDRMHSIMVKNLPTGCRLTALFDSCHSGSVLDLPYLYHTNGRQKKSQVTKGHMKEKYTAADVISWSGCEDDQTSADTTEQGMAVGAMSYAFILALSNNKNQTYQQLLRSIREILRKHYSQKPQLSSSHQIDITLRFNM